MNVIQLSKEESKAHACHFHPELPASVFVVRKVYESVYLCGICYR